MSCQPGDRPEPGAQRLRPQDEEGINPSDAAIVAGPLRRQQDILYAEIDLSRVPISHRSLDVAGHYARPDIFTLHIDTRTQSPGAFG